MSPRAVIGAVAALLLAGLHILPAQAQEADRDKFAKFLHTDQHRQLIDSALAVLPPQVFQRCSTLKVGELNILVRQHIVFGSNDLPVAGEWLERAPVSGCGNDTLLNVYFGFDKTGRMRTITAFPGTTHADLVLQHDAGEYAMHEAHMKQPNCQAFMVLTTHFQGYGRALTPEPAPGAKDLSWREDWTLNGCGKQINIPMHFTPAAGGTSLRPDGAK